MSTGIPLLDALLKLAGNFFVTWLLIVAMKRITSMFHNHAYGQLAGTFIFFVIAYAFVNFPDKTTKLIGVILDIIFSKLSS